MSANTSKMAISGEYIPTYISVDQVDIDNAKNAMACGIEYARECLIEHDTKLGRTTYRNKCWAETMENDIRKMKIALERLKNL